MGSEGNDFIMPKTCPSYLTRRHFSKLVVWFSGGHHSEHRCWMGAYFTDEQSGVIWGGKRRKVFVEPPIIDKELHGVAVDRVEMPVDKNANGLSEQSSSGYFVQLCNEFIFINQVCRSRIIRIEDSQ